MTEKVEKDQAKSPRPSVAARRFSLEAFKLELRRIEWPTRKVILQSSSAVLAIMISFGILVSALDLGVGKLVGLLRFGN